MMFIVSLFNLMKQDAVVLLPTIYVVMEKEEMKEWRKTGGEKKHTQIVSNISFSMSRQSIKK